MAPSPWIRPVTAMNRNRKDDVSPPTAEYGVEVLCAGWNPAAAGLAVTVIANAAGCREPQLGDADAKLFLQLFYRAQQT